jgi:hypothetical protein
MKIIYTFGVEIDGDDNLVIKQENLRWDIKDGRLITGAVQISAQVFDASHPNGFDVPAYTWTPAYNQYPHDPPTASDTDAVLNPPLPHEDMHPVEAARLQGRGMVTVIQQPSRANGYELIIKFNDPEPGADWYKATVTARTIQE